ncbi:hypothetical protein BTO05_04215 [Winogradskyella sp. PC-19]|uniref:hypothetical protein n=1 Tax=unclassified Winogradskyella TaxID=2615021 RepID=UPI000B3CDB96|nr:MULTISPECIES: hypothetical protein [unclassified Winogradskyella]ARV08879.1 hypothetical protein BTO05_04215 [Winogradskyella sp. PC-19]
MKNTFKILLLISITFFTVISCQDTNPLYGEWKLSSWYIGVEIDLDKNGIKSTNLLDEVDCDNKEVLTIKSDGTLNAVNTYNPIVKISKNNSKYVFDVNCNKGALGFASTYKTVGDTVVIAPNNEEFIFSGKQLTRVFKNAIRIYNNDFTEVIETKDLTLSYTK